MAPGYRRAIVLALSLLLAAGLGRLFPDPTDWLDAQLGDLAWRLNATAQPEERIVLIDIDESSLAQLGPWPWPRARLAELARRLAEAGVQQQIWDIVLDAERADDAKLAAELRAQGAVLAVAFALPGQGAPIATGRLAPQPGHTLPCTAPWPEAQGQRAPAPAFAGLRVGHIAYRVDRDGLVRAIPAYVCRQGQAYPALSLAAWLAMTKARAVRLIAADGPWSPPWRLEAAGLPEAIPLDARGHLIVPYGRQPSAFTAISAADLLAGRVNTARLSGRIALIGSTALELTDAVATPFAGAQGGLLVHAELLAGLLDARLPAPPTHARVIALGLLLPGLILLWVAAGRLTAWSLPALAFAYALLLLGLQLILLPRGLALAMSGPAAALLLAGFTLAAFEHRLLAGEARRLLAHLESLLPPRLVRRLAGEPPGGELAAELIDASCLVADIRNFTAWSETRTPAEVAALLHRYFTVAHAIIDAEGGRIEALEGDAILALWRADATADHPARALAAARALQARIAPLLPTADPAAVPPPMALGIGLEAGPVLTGLVGPRPRRQHLALGQPVSRAVRLAALTAELASPILIGPQLYARLDAATRQRLVSRGEFLLEGMCQPCEVWSADERA